MTKLDKEYSPSINGQEQGEESIQAHLFLLFHENFSYLAHKVVIRFCLEPTLSPRGRDDFKNKWNT